MAYAIPGPCLLDLGVRTSSTVAQTTSMYIWRSAGTLVGLLAAGPVYDYINDYLLISVALGFMGITMAVTPYWTDLIWLCITMALFGFFAGFNTIGKLSNQF